MLLTSPGDQSNAEGDSVSLQLQASAAGGGSITYSAAGLPPGLSLNSSTGLVSGTLAAQSSNGSPYTVTATASSGSAGSSQTFTWTVTHILLGNPGDQSSTDGSTISLPVSASDPDGDPLTFSATGLPPGLSMNSGTGLIAGTIAPLASGNSPYQVTLRASDGSVTASQTFNWTITHIALANPGDQINAQGDTVSLPISGSDPDGDTLTYGAAGLPPGLSINPGTGLISGTLAASAGTGSPYAVTVTASDGSYAASQSFTWIVTNGGVTLTSPGDQSNTIAAVISLPISASDPAGYSLTYTALGLPLGLAMDSTTGLISGTIDPSAATTNGGLYTVTLMADDGEGGTASVHFNWTVTQANLAPQVINPGDQTNKDGDSISLPVYAFDPDGDTLTFSATGLPPGLGLNSTTGVISGTLSSTASDGSPYTVTVTASDGTLTGSQTFTWAVGSVLLTSPGDQSNAEGDSVSLQLQASASDGGSITYSATGLPPGLSVNSSTGLITGTLASLSSNNSPYTVTATATSGSANSSQTFTWTVTHILLSNPGDQSNTQGDTASLPISGSDPDGDTLTFSTTGLPSGLSIDSGTGVISGTIASTAGQATPYAVTVTATDGNHTASQTFNWTVNAIQVTVPDDQYNVVGDTVSLQVQAVDGSGGTLGYSASGLPAGLGINSSTGLITGTLPSAAARDVPYQVTGQQPEC